MVGKDALDQTLDRLHSTLGNVEAMAAKFRSNDSAATITVNAGGVGVWIATTACLVMFAVNVLLGALFVIQDGKINKMQDYLNAIYMQAPQLRPKEATK